MNECATLCMECAFSIDVCRLLLQASLAGVPVDGSVVDASATTFACVNMSGTLSSFLMFCESVYLITQRLDSYDKIKNHFDTDRPSS